MKDAVPLSDARNGLSDLVNRATYGGDRVVLSRNGKPVAALISLADLEALEAFEEASDVTSFDKALIEWEADGRQTVTLDEVKTRLAPE